MSEPAPGAASVDRLKRRLGLIAGHAGNGLVAAMLLAMGLIPVVEFVGRKWFNTGIPGANEYLQHLTLWVAFAGAVLASREEKHLKLELLRDRIPHRVAPWTQALLGFLGSAVCLTLTGASIELIVSEAPALSEAARGMLPAWTVNWLEPFGLWDSGNLTRIGAWLPVWVAETAMPLGFVCMAAFFVGRSGSRWWARALVLGLALLAAILLLRVDASVPGLVAPLVGLLLVGFFLGLPIFILLGGMAVLLFWGQGITIAAIPAETYRIVTSPVFPTIPIFTLCGFILSESRADERLVHVFRTWFGWLPGGTAVAATLLCAFLTTFTGASGVTILALGGLLLPVLVQSGYRERFSIGLLTSTGSIGLLFPPSLVVILYAVMAQVPVPDMFIAGILPGLVLVGAVSLYCVVEGVRTGTVERTDFVLADALAALWKAKWEVAIPPLVLFLLFGGFCTLVESAALIVVYELVIETFVYRDLNAKKIYHLLVQCGALMGGVLIILGVAMGLTSFLVDAEVPVLAAEWVKANIQSPLVFLLLLNVALILVGCVMDIFAALVVVVPIILPMAAVFGIDPIHLGVIFLVNLQVGYLTPPVGMNLFLASFRFERPLSTVYRAAIPFLLIMLVVVLVITFVPWLTLCLVR